MKTENI